VHLNAKKFGVLDIGPISQKNWAAARFLPLAIRARRLAFTRNFVLIIGIIFGREKGTFFGLVLLVNFQVFHQNVKNRAICGTIQMLESPSPKNPIFGY
jgi:hypothetical protein